MKTYFLLLFFFFTSHNPNLDLGLPAIQAICKIELKTGEEEEGIISFGGGGYHWKYTPHGFYFHSQNNSQVKLFNLDLRKINFDLEDKEIFYLENKTKPFQSFEMNSKGDSVLTRQFEEKFKMHKEFTIYKSLPINIHVGFDTTLQQKRIQVDNISSFELVTKPSQKWMDLISEARTELSKVEDTYTDYYEPVWYHEVRKNKEKRNYLIRYFPR